MENNTIDALAGNSPASQKPVSENADVNKTSESNLKSIHLAGDRFVIREEAPIRSYEAFRLNDSTADLPGVFFQGTQYYDLKNIYFINNTGMANLIDLLKSLLERNVDVQFVNVCDKIKTKIKSLGLDQIIICS